MSYKFHPMPDGVRICRNKGYCAYLLCVDADFIAEIVAALNRKPPGRKGYATEAERQAARRETMRRANAKRRKT